MAATVWKGFVSFGLVSFPVRLQVAAREKSIQFHLLHKKDLSRVKEVYFCQAEDKPLKREDLVKGFEVSKDEYVVIDQADLDKIAPKTAKVMDILEFVKAGDFDPVLSRQVLPCDSRWRRHQALRALSRGHEAARPVRDRQSGDAQPGAHRGDPSGRR